MYRDSCFVKRQPCTQNRLKIVSLGHRLTTFAMQQGNSNKASNSSGRITVRPAYSSYTVTPRAGQSVHDIAKQTGTKSGNESDVPDASKQQASQEKPAKS